MKIPAAANIVHLYCRMPTGITHQAGWDLSSRMNVFISPLSSHVHFVIIPPDSLYLHY